MVYMAAHRFKIGFDSNIFLIRLLEPHH